MSLLRVWRDFIMTACQQSRNPILPHVAHLVPTYCRFQNGKKGTLIQSKYSFCLCLIECHYHLIRILSQIIRDLTHPTQFAMNHFNIIPHLSVGVYDFLQTVCLHLSFIPCVLHAPLFHPERDQAST
jgi:hypothetical protein